MNAIFCLDALLLQDYIWIFWASVIEIRWSRSIRKYFQQIQLEDLHIQSNDILPQFHWSAQDACVPVCSCNGSKLLSVQCTCLSATHPPPCHLLLTKIFCHRAAFQAEVIWFVFANLKFLWQVVTTCWETVQEGINLREKAMNSVYSPPVVDRGKRKRVSFWNQGRLGTWVQMGPRGTAGNDKALRCSISGALP